LGTFDGYLICESVAIKNVPMKQCDNVPMKQCANVPMKQSRKISTFNLCNIISYINNYVADLITFEG
jgi:hypothetical protein